MKCTFASSEDTSMSASLRLRILSLVMTTADLINERATPSLGISHAIIAPVAIFTTYFFIVILIVGSMRDRSASYFLQSYALITCSAVQIYLSLTVFKELRWKGPKERNSSAALVLNGVLPMLLIFITLADLVLVFFSNRNIPSPVLPDS